MSARPSISPESESSGRYRQFWRVDLPLAIHCVAAGQSDNEVVWPNELKS
jgi:hypothetical protein